MVSPGHGSPVSDLGSLGLVNLLRLVLVWAAASVPVSVVTGAILAAGGADGARRPAAVPTTRWPAHDTSLAQNASAGSWRPDRLAERDRPGAGRV